MARSPYRVAIGAVAATIIVGAAAGGGAYIHDVVTGGGQSPPGTANLFVDTNGGACARSATTIAYIDAAACGSFSAAYAAAQCGDTVLVVAATYPQQIIANAGAHACTPSTKVVFNSTGGTVNAAIWTKAPYVQFENMSLSQADVTGYVTGTNTCPANLVTDVTYGPNDLISDPVSGTNFRNVSYIYDTIDTLASTQAARNQSVSSEFHDNTAATGCLSDGLTFDHTTIENLIENWDGVAVAPHDECLILEDFSNITITNSKFINCAHYDVALSASTRNMVNVTIKNNVFDYTCSHQNTGNTIASGVPGQNCAALGNLTSFAEAAAYVNVNIDFNSIYGGTPPVSGTFSGTNSFVGNIIAGFQDAFHCSLIPGIYASHGYNVDFGSVVCAGDIAGPSGWVDPTWPAKNFAIGPGASGCDLVPTSATPTPPSTDIAATARPDGGESFVDAGAYEGC